MPLLPELGFAWIRVALRVDIQAARIQVHRKTFTAVRVQFAFTGQPATGHTGIGLTLRIYILAARVLHSGRHTQTATKPLSAFTCKPLGSLAVIRPTQGIQLGTTRVQLPHRRTGTQTAYSIVSKGGHLALPLFAVKRLAVIRRTFGVQDRPAWIQHTNRCTLASIGIQLAPPHFSIGSLACVRHTGGIDGFGTGVLRGRRHTLAAECGFRALALGTQFRFALVGVALGIQYRTARVCLGIRDALAFDHRIFAFSLFPCGRNAVLGRTLGVDGQVTRIQGCYRRTHTAHGRHLALPGHTGIQFAFVGIALRVQKGTARVDDLVRHTLTPHDRILAVAALVVGKWTLIRVALWIYPG